MGTEFTSKRTGKVIARRSFSGKPFSSPVLDILVSEDEWKTNTQVVDEAGNFVWRLDLERRCSIHFHTASDFNRDARLLEEWAQDRFDWTTVTPFALDQAAKLRDQAILKNRSSISVL